MKYKVWDEHNEYLECARDIEAESAEDAALAYAIEDHDGLREGCYTRHRGDPIFDLENEGHTVCVLDAMFVKHRFAVGVVEYEPTFAATTLSVTAADETESN